MENELDIRALRKELGDITQVQLANAIGVDQSTVSNWEKGQNAPRGPAMKILLSLKPEDFAHSEAAQ